MRGDGSSSTPNGVRSQTEGHCLSLDKSEVRLASCFCCHDDHWFLEASIRSFLKAGPVIVFVSRIAWDGSVGDYQKCVQAAEKAGAEVVLGEWGSEADHRRFVLEEAKKRGFRYCLIPDGDEVIEPALLDTLIQIAEAGIAERVSVRWDTYWRSKDHVIRPREPFSPLILINPNRVEHVALREYRNGRHLHLNEGYGLIHHLSYAGPEERIRRKLGTWSHKAEVSQDWFERVWKGWEANPLMRELHPTRPSAYDHAVRIEPPPALSLISEPTRKEICFDGPWPKISVIIPLYGGEDDIKACLDALQALQAHLHEVIVVDDKSPDRAAESASSYPFVRLLENQVNLGFAATCNRGWEASTGDVALFLNSDTVVPQAGLVRLIEALCSEGAVGAAGPVSNCVGHRQQIAHTYESLEAMPLFAEDLAVSDLEDVEVDMLVGFCLAVKRRVLEEVGTFDERFGIGTFEDNDLCYRIRRAGYGLRIASRAFVHHAGSKSLKRGPTHPAVLMRNNERLFRDKWREDLEAGYSNGLSGLTVAPIVFDSRRRPDKRRREIEKLSRCADVTLCMIVRNEERVLGECLKSAAPFFKQMVVVDTGSTDRTREIAAECGAELYDYPWTDSFSDARNESLKHASGRWIFWLDADDTLPWNSGETILEAAINALPNVHGFIVPVQFVEDGPGAGTRVDHVKLFRNLPQLAFEGRIHEQILGTLRLHGGEIARLDAVVLHSGYDTSTVGQAKKRTRDEKLLKLDLEERPNHPFVLFNLGMTSHYTGHHEEAVHWLEKCLEASSPGESHVRKAYALLGVSRRNLGEMERAKETFSRGLEVVGNDPEIHFQAGLLFTNMGMLEEALEHYLSIEQDSRHFSSIDIGILGHKRLFNLGVIAMQLGDYPQAKQWWLQAIASQPTLLTGYSALFDAAIVSGDYKTAKEMHDLVRQQEGIGPTWIDLGARFFEAIEGPTGGDRFLESTALAYPGHLEAQLAFARRLLTTQREAMAIPALRQCAFAGSAEAAFLLGVFYIRSGDYEGALSHLEMAQELNPDHEQTVEQITNLKAALAAI